MVSLKLSTPFRRVHLLCAIEVMCMFLCTHMRISLYTHAHPRAHIYHQKGKKREEKNETACKAAKKLL